VAEHHAICPISSERCAVCSDYKFALEALDRPVISAEEAAALVERHWGLRVLSVKELGSYEDRNYLVEGEQHCNSSDISSVCRVSL
jgi:hypothetical protein